MRKNLFILFLLTQTLFLSGQSQKYLRVKVFAKTTEHYNALMLNGLAFESAKSKPGNYFITELSEQDFAKIKEIGIETEILVDDLESYYVNRNKGFNVEEMNLEMRNANRNIGGVVTPVNFTLGTLGGYHSYSEILAELDKMRNLFPNLISAKNIVNPSLTTIEGRPIHWVRISNNPDVDQDKPKVLYNALTHAREPAGMQQMLFQMWYLLENYNTNPEIKALVDNLEIYFIPCVNPDGYVYNEINNPNGGGMWRKNRRNNGDGSIGVDLNRNFGYMWGYDNLGSSPTGTSETYRGTAPFSEPETQNIKYFCESRQFQLALNNHTYSDILIYPWGYENILTPDSTVFIEYAKRMTKQNGYIYGTCYQTLFYLTNGDSDDWFYGEQTTKNKVLAFTPEAGNPIDGFWPAMDKIEALCAGHTEMNLYIMRFALPYSEITDISDLIIDSHTYDFTFNLKSLGWVENANFSVSITPVSSNILSVGDSLMFSNMNVLDEESGSIQLSLKGNTTMGSRVVFAVHVNNGVYVQTDTITKFYGELIAVVDDNCETMDNWISETWNTTILSYHSPTKSITDSPNGNYPTNAMTTINYKNPIDLGNSSYANIEFWAKWTIEKNFDYVQLQVSENNEQWVPLEGLYTHSGTEDQDPGKPVYDGSSDWVKEYISLEEYLGKTIYLRFILVSDDLVSLDGFYFDDFKLMKMDYQLEPTMNLPERFEFEQATSLHVDFTEYIATLNFDNLNLSWEGNSNIEVSKTDWIITFKGANDTWLGEENITFILDYGSGQIQSSTIVEIKEPVGIEQSLSNGFFAFYQRDYNRLVVSLNPECIGQTVEIYSIRGEKLYSKTISSETSYIDVANFSNGVYFVKTTNGIALKVLIY
ncbi:MAG TPA: M14 family zinc carboxypeptidase [Salinivirgaceae bacterium]|nr:M14 family zinc carboxypeptidase [Salinivirgaceae bacterium]